MSIISTILWALVILVGIPMGLSGLALYLNRRSLQDADNLERTDIRHIKFEQFPWFVRALIARYRTQALSIGFTELICVTRPGLGAANYSCILVSPDRKTIAEVEYVRLPTLYLILILFIRPLLFIRFLIGAHGLAITSVFQTPNQRRLVTTGHAFLAQDHVAGEKEFNVVSNRLPISEKFAQHVAARERLISAENLKCREFGTQQEFLDFEREVLRKLAAMQREAATIQIQE